MFEFLITVLVITLLTAVLASIMVIADKTIASYGEMDILVNNEKKLTVEGGKPLLSTLKDHGIFIPSACGGKGSCGLCKVRVNSGAGEYLPTELPYISREEKKDNIRLSCQVKVKKPFEIIIPKELFSIRQFETEVISIYDLTHDIKQVTLRIKDDGKISFQAGQFIQFEVPPYDMIEDPVYRAYSISSSPSENNTIELEIRYVPEGLCTTFVHKHLKVGDEVTINGPYGDFYLRDSMRDIVFIAGGSGMAPIKSMLLDMKEKNNTRNAVYFFGARAKKDLFLLSEMKRLETELHNFKFIPSLSNPNDNDDWNGEIGIITNTIEKYIGRHKKSEGSENGKECYLCGSPGMINACVDVLINKCGIEKDLIFYDKFS